MDGHRFDHIARRFARSQSSRRGALKLGGLGVSTMVLAASGFAANGRSVAGQMATPEATPADAVKTEDGWLCQQRYALCTTAPCEPAADDATTVTCRCRVEDGYSFGFTECGDRTPTDTTLISTFSTQDVTSSFHELACPDGSPWANCLDMPCEIDPNDPEQATCQCEVVESGAFVTMGGEDCDTGSCSSVIWSGNYPDSPVVPQYVSAMQQIGQQITLPQACPDDVATPAALATPADT